MSAHAPHQEAAPHALIQTASRRAWPRAERSEVPLEGGNPKTPEPLPRLIPCVGQGDGSG